VRLADHRVIQDPDPQVQQGIERVLRKFEEFGPCYRGLRYCQQHAILFPRRHRGAPAPGARGWRQPSDRIIRSIITKPAYAGAFVSGRRTRAPQRPAPGRRTPTMVRRPMEQWPGIRHDASPASISWAQFVANQERLREHAQRDNEKTGTGGGAPREGAAFLQGLITCGRCGYGMTVAYRPRARYTCAAMTRRFAAARCVHLAGPPIEACVVQAFFDAIAPAQREALEEVLAQRQRDHQRLDRSHHQHVTPARFSATLARRRYEHVDPQYRLAAAALERDWDDKLRARRQAEEAAARFAQTPAESTFSPELRAQLVDLSHTLPAWGASAQLRHDQRQALLRSLISQVMVTRLATDRVAVKSIWVSGHSSEGIVIPPGLHQRHVTGYDTMVERLGQWWAQGATDIQIAEPLSAEGVRAARRDRVLPKTVLRIRRPHQWVSRSHQHRLADKRAGMWTIHGLSAHLGVPREWFSHRMHSGFLRAPDVTRKPPYGNYLLRDDTG
jgi:hypothetical protein